MQPEIRVWFNPRLESRDFMIPGIVALLLLVITTNLSAMAIVREKEIGTLEQLNVTPLARWELITGKLLPYAFIGIIDVVLVLIVAIYWFEVPMRGSIPLLFGMCLIYLLSTLGLGLFVSTISQTQQQAMMTTIFFFLTPMMYLSGFIFPIENMPRVDPAAHLPDSAALLPGDRAGNLPEGHRPRDPVAAGAGAACLGLGMLTLATLRSSKGWVSHMTDSGATVTSTICDLRISSQFAPTSHTIVESSRAARIPSSSSTRLSTNAPARNRPMIARIAERLEPVIATLMAEERRAEHRREALGHRIEAKELRGAIVRNHPREQRPAERLRAAQDRRDQEREQEEVRSPSS